MTNSNPMTTINETTLKDIACRALCGLGLAHDDATDAARILVLAELFGVTTHGVSRIESYGERLEIGGIAPRPNIKVDQAAPSISMVDGDNGVGPLVGYRALEAAMKSAGEFGVGVAFARGSNHFGPVAPYNFIAAEQGFASFICSNATTTITPWGGKEARLGNSPLGFGIPNPAGDPIILDMAMSVVARAKIRNAAKAGSAIPSTWATDKQGQPTTDPKAALEGFLLPVGGHKGYGLALIVDLFAGVLSGAAYLSHVKSWVDAPGEAQNLGHFFLLIDTNRLGQKSWLAERMTDFADILHSTPATNPDSPVLLPGEIELRNLARQRKMGISIDKGLLAKIQQYADRGASVGDRVTG